MEPPVLNCSDEIVVPTLPGMNYALVIIPPPSVTDNSLEAPFTDNSTNTFLVGIGTFQVGITAEDASGNEATCFVTIEVQDRESPNITCPGDITRQQRPNSAFVNVTWSDPVVVDNSGFYSQPVFEPESGSLFGVGNTTVNVSSQDASGNVGSCQFVVTVLDLDECANASYNCHENAQCINSKGNFTCECNTGFEDFNPSYPGRLCEDVTLPNITGCPDSQSVPTLPGLPYVVVSWIEPNASDSSGYVSLVFNGPGRNGGAYNIGEYNVTYTAMDGAGNAATCQFVINVLDVEAPNITCPPDVTQSTDPGLYTAIVSWSQPYIVDNSGNFTVTATHSSGDEFSAGNTPVTITAEDENRESPNITCPEDIRDVQEPGSYTVNVSCGCPASQSKPTLPELPYALFSWIEPNASDTSMEVTLAFNGPGENGGRYNISDYNVTYTAIDSAGNTAVCLFEISVRDEEFPNITCPEDITQSTDAGLYSADVSWPDTQIIDNSGSVSIQANYTSGDMFPVGNTTVVIAVEDESGNEGLPYANVSWKEPVVIDISGTMSLIFNGPGTNGGPYDIGEYNVTYTASDEAGNTAYCSFIITVIDYELPNVTCPDDIELELNPETAAANVSWSQPTVTDNSGFFSLAPSQPPPGSLFQVGTTTVNVTASDPSGNIGYCLFLVNLIDYDECSNDVDNCHDNATCVNTKGTFTCQCREGYLDLDSRNPGRSCQDIDECASVSDCHANATCTNTDGNFTCECNGGFDDQNIAYPGRSCEDSESPNITCPGDIEVAQDQGSKTANVSWATPVVVDNSGFFTEPISSPESGALFDLGNTTVTVTSRDESGNVGSCQFTVTVIVIVDYARVTSFQSLVD
ncbi:hyalin-like [Diadema antillarum]|uniref:hyalin-like n=1 Tax=Diadema antillarum TaxID=105358 RepID=UPI003A885EE4